MYSTSNLPIFYSLPVIEMKMLGRKNGLQIEDFEVTLSISLTQNSTFTWKLSEYRRCVLISTVILMKTDLCIKMIRGDTFWVKFSSMLTRKTWLWSAESSYNYSGAKYCNWNIRVFLEDPVTEKEGWLSSCVRIKRLWDSRAYLHVYS